MANSVDPRLLDVLVDPVSKVPLRYNTEKQELINDGGRRAYPIRDGVPVMIASEAREVSETEIKK